MSARIRCGKNAIVDGKVAFLLLFDDSRVLAFTIKLFVLPERSVNKFCCIHFTSIKSYVTLMIRGICSKLTTKTLDLRQWTGRCPGVFVVNIESIHHFKLVL